MPDWIWLSIAMLLIVEGIGPLLFPNKWRVYMQMLSKTGSAQLRQIGGTLVVMGVISLFYLL